MIINTSLYVKHCHPCIRACICGKPTDLRADVYLLRLKMTKYVTQEGKMFMISSLEEPSGLEPEINSLQCNSSVGIFW